MTTLEDIKRKYLEEAIAAGPKLQHARLARNERAIGYWKAYIRDRERFILDLSAFEDG